MIDHGRRVGLAWQVVGVLFAILFLPSCNPFAWLVSAPVVTQRELAQRLSSDNRPAIYDLREQPDFAKEHIPTAQRVVFGDVGTAARLLPSDRELVLVCYHGGLAALAAPSVRGAGHERVVVLAGGMSEWVNQGGAVDHGSGDSLGPLVAPKLTPTMFASILAYAAGVVIKPTYMLLSLGLILWLRHTQLRELRLMRTGLVMFLGGETACLFNFYLSDPRAPLEWLECLHELGMAVGSAYGFWGAYEIIDAKLLGMNDLSRSCALTRFCGSCTRKPDLLCKPQQQLRHLMLLLLPLVTFPWSLELLVRDTSVVLFGTTVEYRWAVLNQVLELRVFPILALIALTLGWALSGKRRRRITAGHRAFFLGLGLLSFSVMRGLLDATFTRRPYWADTWEEVTELLGIASIGLILWIFRHRLELGRGNPVGPVDGTC